MSAGEVIGAALDRCVFPDSPSVICAVSGGADSSALLILAAHAREDVTAFHIDHGLRDSGEEEAEAVATLARRLGARFECRSVQVDPGSNLEARAREARRRVLPPEALLGHTADDLAETILLQLLRGGALDALASMDRSTRPMLALRRSDTEAVCRVFGHTPVMDPSNEDSRFRRNRIRNEVLPLLNDVMDRDVVPLLARAGDLALADREVLDALAAEIDPTDAAALVAAHPALARRAVRAWLRDPHPPDAAAVERVLEVARKQRVATEVDGARRVSRSGGVLAVELAPSPRRG